MKKSTIKTYSQLEGYYQSKIAEAAGLVADYLDIYHQIIYYDPFPKESWLLRYEQQNLDKVHSNFSTGAKNLSVTQIAAEIKYIDKTLSQMRKYKKNLVDFYRRPEVAKNCAAQIAEKTLEINLLYDNFQKTVQPKLERLGRKKSWAAVLQVIMETEYSPGLEKHVLIDGNSFHASEELSKKTQKIIKGLRAARKAIPEKAYAQAAIKLTREVLKDLDKKLAHARSSADRVLFAEANNSEDTVITRLLQHRRRARSKLRRLEEKLDKFSAPRDNAER